MVTPERPEREECPACGGSGGGPFGPAGSAWDIETYECVRCEGWGYLRAAPVANEEEASSTPRPGIAKATPERTEREQTRRRASSGE